VVSLRLCYFLVLPRENFMGHSPLEEKIFFFPHILVRPPHESFLGSCLSPLAPFFSSPLCRINVFPFLWPISPNGGTRPFPPQKATFSCAIRQDFVNEIVIALLPQLWKFFDRFLSSPGILHFTFSAVFCALGQEDFFFFHELLTHKILERDIQTFPQRTPSEKNKQIAFQYLQQLLFPTICSSFFSLDNVKTLMIPPPFLFPHGSAFRLFL